MKTSGAINRQRRRKDQQRATEASAPKTSSEHRAFGLRAARYTFLEDCGIAGADVGLDIPKGSVVDSRRLRLSQNNIGIENRGAFHGQNTVID